MIIIADELDDASLLADEDSEETEDPDDPEDVSFLRSPRPPKGIVIHKHGEMEPSTRIELATTSLPWRCSTTELRRLIADDGEGSFFTTELFFYHASLRKAGH